MSAYVTSWADWDGRTTINTAVYVESEPITTTEVVADADDDAVQAFADHQLARLGLERFSSWTVGTDPASTDPRPVFLASIRRRQTESVSV